MDFTALPIAPSGAYVGDCSAVCAAPTLQQQSNVQSTLSSAYFDVVNYGTAGLPGAPGTSTSKRASGTVVLGPDAGAPYPPGVAFTVVNDARVTGTGFIHLTMRGADRINGVAATLNVDASVSVFFPAAAIIAGAAAPAGSLASSASAALTANALEINGGLCYFALMPAITGLGAGAFTVVGPSNSNVQWTQLTRT